MLFGSVSSYYFSAFLSYWALGRRLVPEAVEVKVELWNRLYVHRTQVTYNIVFGNQAGKPLGKEH